VPVLKNAKHERFYVYAVRIGGQTRYVGKGTGQRAQTHLRASHNATLRAEVSAARATGVPVRVKIVVRSLSEREAYRRNSTRKTWSQYVEHVRSAAQERRAARDAKAAKLREAREAAAAEPVEPYDNRVYRSQMADRAASRRMSRASSEPKIIELQRADLERIEAVVVEITAAEAVACKATTWRHGFRVRCMMTGEHSTHISTRGDAWGGES
jgi:hypothetical protein